jgi:hypothetical protein
VSYGMPLPEKLLGDAPAQNNGTQPPAHSPTNGTHGTHGTNGTPNPPPTELDFLPTRRS